MRELTSRQKQILDLIRDRVISTGAPPTRAEIATQLGFRSPNAAEDHLRALARKGAIALAPGTSRGIRLTHPDYVPHLVASEAPAAARASVAQTPLSLAKPTARTSQGSGWAIPLVGRVAAGQPILAENHVESSFQVDPDLFTQRPDYLLRVRGQSMRDAGILDGDLLAVRSARDARNGQIVVARLGNEVTVKRFRRPHPAGPVELLPENPEFTPIVIGSDPDQAFSIEGIAVGLIRPRELS